MDQHTQPSEGDMQLQLEKAQSVWGNEVEEEGGAFLIQAVCGSGQSGAGSIGGFARAQVAEPKGKAAAKKRSKASTSESVGVLAAQARAKSAKEFADAVALLKRALVAGETLLSTTAVKILGSEERVANDPTLSLVKSRMTLVEAALNESQGNPGKIASEALFEEAMKDPYLSELSTAVFKDKEGVQTVGQATYFRNVVFDLQPDKMAVENQLINHRTVLSALKRIGETLMTEVDSWRTHVVALKKAAEQEAKAIEKANKKAEEAEAKRLKREAAKEAAAKKKEQLQLQLLKQMMQINLNMVGRLEREELLAPMRLTKVIRRFCRTSASTRFTTWLCLTRWLSLPGL